MQTKSFSITTFLFIFLMITATSCKSNKNQDDLSYLMDTIKIDKQLPDWAKAANIYEVNIRQYTPEGTFNAFTTHLPRLQKMGVDILWLMPVSPVGEMNRKGSLGSYYSISDYTAVNPEFGTMEDFKTLVNEAHKLGMKIILDWVANHTAWDHVWMEQHKDWYTQDSTGNVIVPAGTDWYDTADLNYDKPELRKAMIDALSFWVKEADIDGFRCDVAGMVPLTFWLHARKTIDEIKPGCFFLAEDSNPEIHQAFDMSYSWPLKDVINDIAKGKKNATDVVNLLSEESKKFGSNDLRMLFITNHDENSWHKTEYERLGESAVDAFNTLIYVLPGMPLTYTGQEEPMKKSLRFFDKDTVGFGQYSRQELLSKLNTLKKDNPALWNVGFGGTIQFLKNSDPESILCVLRQKDNNKVLSIFNLSGKEQSFTIDDPVSSGLKHNLGEKLIPAKDGRYTLKGWGYGVMVE
jgi:glycosidase